MGANMAATWLKCSGPGYRLGAVAIEVADRPIDHDFDPKQPERRGNGWMLDDQRPTMRASTNRALGVDVGETDYRISERQADGFGQGSARQRESNRASVLGRAIDEMRVAGSQRGSAATERQKLSTDFADFADLKTRHLLICEICENLRIAILGTARRI
jgi:hypothetical protein